MGGTAVQDEGEQFSARNISPVCAWIYRHTVLNILIRPPVIKMRKLHSIIKYFNSGSIPKFEPENWNILKKSQMYQK